jgi:TPR repeat protein
MRACFAVLGVALLVTGCLKEEWVDAKEPTQGGDEHAMTKRGGVAFDQRKSDCWDMPNAQACYDVGLNYELGLVVKPDIKTALEYYAKACQLDKEPEHCSAAERMRSKNN